MTTWYVLRTSAWAALRRDLNAAGVEIVAPTPWDVILLQTAVSLLVGLVLALEVAGYRARDDIPLGRWRPALPDWARRSLAAVGLALLPVGAALGYDHVVPALLTVLEPGAGGWTIVRWAGVALVASLATGVAAQLALVGAVLTVGRLRDGPSG